MLNTINSFTVRQPDECQFGFVPVFGGTTMTTQLGKTLTGVTKLKRKLVFTWTDVPIADATAILQAVYASQYTAIDYFDLYSGQNELKAFYLEDEVVLPIKYWSENKKYIREITFTFIEREVSSDVNS